MGDGLRHVVHRRVHLERSQVPGRKARVGKFLEKKKDYKQRAQRYHVLEQNIKQLAAKTRFRNEDEFNFKMVHCKLDDDGQVVLENNVQQQLRKMNTRQLFRHHISKLDENRFILKHQINTCNNKLEDFLAENATFMRNASNGHLMLDGMESDDGETESQPRSNARPKLKSGIKVDLDHLNAEAQALKTKVRDKINIDGKLEEQRIIKIAQHQKRRIISIRSKNSKRIIALASQRNK